MIKADTNSDDFISVNCMGEPMQLIKEASGVLANVAEAVGGFLMNSKNMSRVEAESQVITDVIMLAMKRSAEKQRTKKN